MSARDGSVTIAWADGEHTFRLGIKQLEELQEKCNAGPPLVMARLSARMWFLHDVRETLRLGLVGGGMEPEKARLLVNRYAADGHLMKAALVAYTVITTALVGPADEPGKSAAAKEGESVSPIAA